MSLNESRTPGRAPSATPLRPHHQGGSLKFDGDVQPVAEPPAEKPFFSAITDFVDQQCHSVKRCRSSPPASAATLFCAHDMM
jgi:hypothetical protein